MRKALLTVALCALAGTWPLAADETGWPQWRGPKADGTSPDGDPPLVWSEEENVRWKVEVPGQGHATPIVWKDRIYLLSAIPLEAPAEPEAPQAERTPPPRPPPGGSPPGAGPPGGGRAGPPAGRGRGGPPRGVQAAKHRFVVLALSREDGSVVWQQTAAETTPVEGHHRDGTWASASPVTDGEALYAHFGSQGLYAYDLGGKLLWKKDLGEMQTRHAFGEGSSPALWGQTLVVNWDHEGDSYIVALDKRTGKELWKKDRDEATSWATPLVVEVGGRPQVVIPATGTSRGYDLATGDVVWQLAGMTLNVIPSPVYDDGLVILMSGFRGNAVQAIRLPGAKGDLAGTEAVAWTHDRHTPYVPSPLLYDGKLYFLKTNSAILTCMDARTGEVLYTEQRLDGLTNVYASIVGASGRVYVAGRNGTTLVLKHGKELEILASNTLDDGFDASPAIAGRELYLRGRSHLYSLAEDGGGGREAAGGR